MEHQQQWRNPLIVSFTALALGNTYHIIIFVRESWDDRN